MRKLLAKGAGLLLAASLALSGAAHAAVINFQQEADVNGERGVTNGSVLTIGGVALTLFAFDDIDLDTLSGDLAFAYLDAGLAGLGVCSALDGADQCNPSSDDNVSDTEAVAITFLDGINSLQRDITDLSFRGANHQLINDLDTANIYAATFGANGAQELFTTIPALIALAQAQDVFFDKVETVAFAFVDTEFYVSSIDVSDVPLPAALPLMLVGLGALRFARRRK